MHQAVLRLVHAAGERHIFSGLVEMGLGVGRQAVHQIGFAGKLVRKFLLRGHGRGMGPRRLGQSFIGLQGRKAGLGPLAVGHLQKLASGLGVVVWGGLRFRRRTFGRAHCPHLEPCDADCQQNRE